MFLFGFIHPKSKNFPIDNPSNEVFRERDVLIQQVAVAKDSGHQIKIRKLRNWLYKIRGTKLPRCEWAMDRERERSCQDVLQCQQTKQLPDIYHYPNKNDRIIQSAFETSQIVIFAIQFLIHFLREKSSKSSNRKNKSKVSELKAEQQQLDGLCLALRRAVHAEGLIMEVWAPKGAHWGWIFGWALGEKTSICCTMLENSGEYICCCFIIGPLEQIQKK